MIKVCPFCTNVITPSDGSHIYRCKSNKTLTNKIDIKYLYIQFNFPEISDKHILNKEYVIEKQSLPLIREKYKIDYKSILWLLKYHNIEKRTSSESCTIGSSRTKETLNRLFGDKITSISQLESIKQKKRETFKKHYGVDNIRKWKPFYDYIKTVIEKKHGVDYSTFISNKGKAVWASKTDDEKNTWLYNSILSDTSKIKSLSSKPGYVVSKLEETVSEFLIELNIIHTRQFMIKNNSKRKFYDFYLPDYDLIIEVNGDYWHANPKKYKPNDVIKYPFGLKTAKEIWDKDLIKYNHAANKNIPIMYIWECDLINNKNNLLEFIKNKIYEMCENKINSKN